MATLVDLMEIGGIFLIVIFSLGFLVIGYGGFVCLSSLFKCKWLMGHQVPAHAAYAASSDQEDSGLGNSNSETSFSASLTVENEHGPFQEQID